MPRLISSIASLRRDPRLLKAPPYVSFMLILVGVVWLLLLPLDNYNRRTYISENALLPGQVHTYFGGSEYNILRAYRHEVDTVLEKGNVEINDKLESILKGVGVKTGRQSYTYASAGEEFSGENLYGILQAPRGDATEAIVLVAAWKSINDEINRNGVSLALTLARYFKRWSLWSKDIILVFPSDSKVGTQAWVDAYHDAHDPSTVASLPLKSGALQGALALDFPSEQKFEAMHVIYDSTNGQLPNLDLINVVVNVAGGQMGIPTAVQNLKGHSGSYTDRLLVIFRGMLTQGLGFATGPHSSFVPYHVDAVTLQPYGQGIMDEMAMGRVVEGCFRSLNNLLEHLHQSFFFYLLMQRDRFVSIGTYLPSAMLLAANFTVMAIALWVTSGQPATTTTAETSSKQGSKKRGEKVGGKKDEPTERSLILPLRIVGGSHALGAVPLFLFNNLPAKMLGPTFTVFTLVSSALPILLASVLPSLSPTGGLRAEHFNLTKSFSLLLLGMFLSTLATLNFSLAFWVGLLASPLTFVGPSANSTKRWTLAGLLSVLSPTSVAWILGGRVAGCDMGWLLKEAAFGWNIWGTWTAVVVWCVWWPAWLVGMVNVLGEVV